LSPAKDCRKKQLPAHAGQVNARYCREYESKKNVKIFRVADFLINQYIK
jgi:hypothetical protein